MQFMTPLSSYEALIKRAKDCRSVERMITTTLPTMDGWCTIEKAFTLAGIVLEIKPALCIEIGNYSGRSFLPILFALRENKNGKAIGIDPYDSRVSSENEYPGHSEWWAGLDHILIEKKFHTFLRNFDLMKWAEVVKKTSDQFTPPEQIDLLHIDGGHTEVAVRDAERYGCKVNPGGIIVMDDIQWIGGSVLRAIDTLEGLGFKECFRNTDQNWNVMQRLA